MKKARIKSKLKRTVVSLCYPFGNLSELAVYFFCNMQYRFIDL